DGWSYSDWVVGTWRIRDVDRYWPRPGARLHHSVGIWPALIDDVTTVRRCVPYRRLVLHAHGWPAGAARVEIVLWERVDGCRIVMAEDVSAGPGRLLPAPFRAAASLPRNRETVNRLISLVEHRARRRAV